MRLTRRDSVLLGLLVLISFSASFPHGSVSEDRDGYCGRSNIQQQHPDFEELCDVLGRHIEIMLRSASVLCVDFVEEEADLEVCLTSPSSNIIIKECAEKHDKTSEASECIVNSVQSNSTSTAPTDLTCVCKSMSDSFLSFQTTGLLVCSKSFLDDIVLDILDLEQRDPRAIFTLAATLAALKAGAALASAAATSQLGSAVIGGLVSVGGAIAYDQLKDEDRDEKKETLGQSPNCSDFAHFFIPDAWNPNALSGEMRGIIGIPKSDSTFYKNKRFSIIHTFKEPLVGELHYQLNLPITQRIFPKKVDDQGLVWKTEQVIFDKVPDHGKVAWSVKMSKVETLKTARVEVNGYELCKEDN